MDSFYLRVIETFNTHSVRYVVVGGFAVNFHGYNRTTGDLDMWISNTDENLLAIKQGLDDLSKLEEAKVYYGRQSKEE